MQKMLTTEEAEAREQELSPYWKAGKKGDAIAGQFVGWQESEYRGKSSVRAVLVNDQGIQKTLPASKNLSKQLRKASVKKDDRVEVIYRMDVDTGAPQPMKVFSVQVNGVEVSDAKDDEPLPE